MHGRLRIAVAELFLFVLIERNDQSLPDYGLEESVAMRRYCLSSPYAGRYMHNVGAAK